MLGGVGVMSATFNQTSRKSVVGGFTSAASRSLNRSITGSDEPGTAGKSQRASARLSKRPTPFLP